MKKKAFVILNLGTPSAPDPESVGRYLTQFLMDEFVIDIPFWARWPLVHLLIVPRRKHKSAEAYGEIWTEEGSPLFVHTKNLANKVASQRAQSSVHLAMRYGQPSLMSVLEDLQKSGFEEIFFAPLYPQYAMSSSGTAIEELGRCLKAMKWQPKVKVLKPFFEDEAFIKAVAQNYHETTKSFQPDFVLMSYHGLPKRHLKKLNSGCLQPGCCDQPSARSQTCYRYQCYRTSKKLAEALALPADKWSVSFQSRLGPGWIEPFTDVVFEELAQKGIKKLCVLSPSFVADCLETLEEIQMRGNELFCQAGGEELRLVPSLNSGDFWVETVANWPERGDIWQEGLETL